LRLTNINFGLSGTFGKKYREIEALSLRTKHALVIEMSPSWVHDAQFLIDAADTAHAQTYASHSSVIARLSHFPFSSSCAILFSSSLRSNLFPACSLLSREEGRMPLEGLQLGRYHLLRLLGSGGMGEVYLAEDARIGQQVAIKVIRSEGIAYPESESAKESARLFEREAKAITRLDHPNILPLYAYGEETLNETLLTYLVMPYRKEGTLANWLRQRGRAAPLSPTEVVPLLQQAADALQHAHDQHVLHQDIKPANFLIRVRSDHPDHPDLLLSDFGIAKLTSATASASQSIRGTPTYMAPEQWDGHPVPATDQYALAIMAYELLVGHPPFQGGPGQVMRQHYLTPPPTPSTLNPRLSPAIDAVLLRALSKQSDERFASVSAFARAFHEAVQSEGDLHATLAISQTEAESGTTRLLTLPGGRRVSVTVPARVGDGTTLRLEGQGMPYYEGGPAGPLVLTIAIPAEASPQPLPQNSTDPTVVELMTDAELSAVEDPHVTPARPEAPVDQEPTVPASHESESASTVPATDATSLPAEIARSSTPKVPTKHAPPQPNQEAGFTPLPPMRRNPPVRLILAVCFLLAVLIGGSIFLYTNGISPFSKNSSGGISNTNNSNSSGSTGAIVNGRGCKKIGVLLPETTTSARWEDKDRPLLQQLIPQQLSGATVDYHNAQGSADTQQTQAQTDLTNGDCILVIAAVGSIQAAAIVSAAKAKGVPVIAYDRLIYSTDLNYYISFDNTKVGQLQGQYIAAHYQSYVTANGTNNTVMINGAQTDNNALLFAAGAHSALDPLFSGALKKVYEKFTPNWDNPTAQAEMQAALLANGNSIAIAYVANDGMANSVIAALKAVNLNGKVLVTGQDATVAGIHNILTGDQAMTVYKKIDLEANATAQLVAAISNGTDTSSLTNGQTTTLPISGSAAIPSVLETPISVDKSNIASTVIADGFVTAADVCQGLPSGTGGICH
jgi:D-xylose transport system substrate-binding protein